MTMGQATTGPTSPKTSDSDATDHAGCLVDKRVSQNEMWKGFWLTLKWIVK